MEKNETIKIRRISKPRKVLKATRIHKVKTKYNRKRKYKINLTNEKELLWTKTNKLTKI